MLHALTRALRSRNIFKWISQISKADYADKPAESSFKNPRNHFSMSSTVPPACCTLAVAEALARWTTMVTRFVSVPSPRSFTAWEARFMRCRALSSSGVTRSPSLNRLSCSTLMISARSGRPVAFCRNPRLGRRRMSGLRPPSNPGRLPDPVRARWPFWPGVAVLPWPEPMPRPTRFLRWRAPGTEGIVDTFMRVVSREDVVLVFRDFNDEAAALADRFLALKGLEPFQRRLDEIHRIAGAEPLREDVPDAGRFAHRPDSTTRDDPRAGACGFEQDALGVKAADDLMRDRRALERHGDHVPLGLQKPFADGVGRLIGPAQRHADAPLAVAHHRERVEAQPLAALVDFGDAVDADQLLHELRPV